MALTRVLIAVKTYPTISTKYDELVCTAGFTEEGKWIRIYPVQFRKLPFYNQYKKYQWIEIDIEKNPDDFRPESYRPVSLDTHPTILNEVDTANAWAERKAIVLNDVYEDLSKLIEDSKNEKYKTSLAVFKPKKVIDFVYEEVEREWDKNKLALMNQIGIFEERDKKLKVVRKLPYKFYYVFEDINDRRSRMMIEDWEVGALFWKYSDNEEDACKKVRQKYFDDFAKTKDLYFFLGTTKEFHARNAHNPFIIIGTFHPTFPKPVATHKKDSDNGQLNLFP
jgi:hypothetical protein